MPTDVTLEALKGTVTIGKMMAEVLQKIEKRATGSPGRFIQIEFGEATLMQDLLQVAKQIGWIK